MNHIRSDLAAFNNAWIRMTPNRPPPHLQRQSVLPDLMIFVVAVSAILYVVLHGAQAMNYHWQWYRVPAFFGRDVDGEFIPGPLLRGLKVTLQIVAFAMVITLAVGLTTALLRLSPSWAARALAIGYIELVRNTPLLIQIFVFYFVLSPLIGINRFWVGVLGLSFFEATLAAEVIRGSIEAVPRGQWEAARAMGLGSVLTLRLVVLPQALPLMLPPLTSVLVNLVKHSAIVSVIAIADLATEGRNTIADTLMSFEVWLTVAAMYLAVTLPLSSTAQWIETLVSGSAGGSSPGPHARH
ncbi:MAG TPA: amino acid ABC transporter permease [Acetobacteraceae bacterium]|nr:amino acid ABC transporter permease [Acetobacteraceae bacterium]